MESYTINAKQAMTIATLSAEHGKPISIATARPTNPNARIHFAGIGVYSIAPCGTPTLSVTRPALNAA